MSRLILWICTGTVLIQASLLRKAPRLGQKLGIGQTSKAGILLTEENQKSNGTVQEAIHNENVDLVMMQVTSKIIAPLTKSNKTPVVVLFSAFMNDIDSVKSSICQWAGDVVATIRYNESEFPAAKPQLQITNGKTTAITEYRKHTENGMVSETTRMKVVMTFAGDFDLFPFDMQCLETQFALKGLTNDDAVLQKDPAGEIGIHEIDKDTGRHFKAAQFRIPSSGWELKIQPLKTSGVPYYKSSATLEIHAQRYLPYYFLTCVALPSLPALFAVGAFFLPISPIVPRVMISFVAFLTIFVHLKQIMSFTPPGVWCWVMTELTFFCVVLTVGILGNICSAIVVQHHGPLAKRHDQILRCVLPFEILLGEMLLLIFKANHFLIGMYIMVPVVVLYHGVVGILFTLGSLRMEHHEKPGLMVQCVSFSAILGPVAALATVNECSAAKTGDNVEEGEVEGEAGGDDGGGDCGDA